MKGFRKICGQEEEIFIRNKKGELKHLLPGESWDCAEDVQTCVFPRRQRLIIPAGAAKDEQSLHWGGYCMLRCRLGLPQRFMIRHEKELMEGKETEKILGDIARNILMEEMAESVKTAGKYPDEKKQQEMWRKIETRIKESFLLEGWIQEECLPGYFSCVRKGGNL